MDEIVVKYSDLIFSEIKQENKEQLSVYVQLKEGKSYTFLIFGTKNAYDLEKIKKEYGEKFAQMINFAKKVDAISLTVTQEKVTFSKEDNKVHQFTIGGVSFFSPLQQRLINQIFVNFWKEISPFPQLLSASLKGLDDLAKKQNPFKELKKSPVSLLSNQVPSSDQSVDDEGKRAIQTILEALAPNLKKSILDEEEKNLKDKEKILKINQAVPQAWKQLKENRGVNETAAYDLQLKKCKNKIEEEIREYKKILEKEQNLKKEKQPKGNPFKFIYKEQEHPLEEELKSLENEKKALEAIMNDLERLTGLTNKEIEEKELTSLLAQVEVYSKLLKNPLETMIQDNELKDRLINVQENKLSGQQKR